jgi:hypothetical protein
VAFVLVHTTFTTICTQGNGLWGRIIPARHNVVTSFGSRVLRITQDASTKATTHPKRGGTQHTPIQGHSTHASKGKPACTAPQRLSSAEQKTHEKHLPLGHAALHSPAH